MQYNFKEIEKKWQRYWQKNQTYKVEADPSQPKYYVLDMFPYPSGAGLHVGHPLGYIATDIFSRYKKLKGFNVLHPMGFDAFGLPAEQYAIETGQHPAITTANNIATYKRQLAQMGFSYDWSREVQTCDPKYYKWTQWLFLKLFNSWYNKDTDKAEPVETLIDKFKKEGKWNDKSEKEQQQLLLNYRLAYLAYSDVNWCPALGTVLANDEVKDGVSERGGHPVIKKSMRQWLLRITAYADRLLNGLEEVDWSDSLKEMQRNWIGRSEGASIDFKIQGLDDVINIFTTRPDTLFGATFMVLAPEHEWVERLTTADRKEAVKKYVAYSEKRSERERQAEVKKITGEFTGTYAIHPFTQKKIPIWISEYVLRSYGSGAIMAVPAHDTRDYAFAKHFDIPIQEVVAGEENIAKEAYEAKDGKLINSDFLNGLNVKAAIQKAIEKAQELGIGKRQVNFRLRDAVFSRQRYWGEPFPIYYKEDIPYAMDESKLPLILPEIKSYKPTESGEAPLANAKDWTTKEGQPIETHTMPGYAGSSWYFLRYMDPHNEKEFVSKKAESYWQNVDCYMGGTEHATGHLLYARFWHKVLFDLGYVSTNEPFKKMLNQGMIQGRSNFVYRVTDTKRMGTGDFTEAISPKLIAGVTPRFIFVSYNLKDQYETYPLHVDVNIVKNDVLDIEAFKRSNKEYKDAVFIPKDGKYICGSEIEKMSKSKLNVVSPDDVVEKYGADTFRMYEMFLGPIDIHKPWDTKGIDGVHRFLKKFWRLFYEENGHFRVTEEEPKKEELKVLHKTIKKVKEDIERFSFNTAISCLMICTNELTALKCSKRTVLEDLLIILSPFAPHITEELWAVLGNKNSITTAKFPSYKKQYIKEDSVEYPIAINGKTRAKINLPVDMTNEAIEKEVLKLETVQKWLDDNKPKKVIIVPGRMINVVV